MKWNMIIDVARCENCNNCLLAAKDELVGNDFTGYSAPHAPQGRGVLWIERHVRGSTPMVDVAYVPRMCNHCDDAPCVKASNGAITKRDDGIVVFDPVKCKGRRDLVAACPYDAVVWNEQAQLPQTWFFDAHLLDTGWDAPRCVAVCPTQVFEVVRATDEEMAVRVKEEGLRPVNSGLGGRPRVHYRNLYRADRCFVGGSLCAETNGRVECVVDAEIRLSRAGTELARTRSDAFGDFRFDDLAPGSGVYRVSVLASGFTPAEVDVDLLASSVVLGEIHLQS
jgi:Fe-S-cluster-containing dehydrogenase component